MENFISHYREHIDQILDCYLPNSNAEPQLLHQAMRYAVLNGGKRLRPLLVYVVGEIFNCSVKKFDAAACAVELIHAYSLVHDDLPAMDDDDFRRGQPTCHKAFNEATAILVGDALHALAFEIISSDENLLAEQRLQMLFVLAKAIGHQGMVGGQAMEFELAEKNIFSLEKIHQLKTGALISASVKLGAIAANANSLQLEQLDRYASALGLAFQIQDDIADKSLDSSEISYLNITNENSAKQRIKNLYHEAMNAIHSLSDNILPLQKLADYMIVLK